MKKKYLKRILSIIVLGVLLVSGCGRKIERVESSENERNEKQNIEQTENESVVEKEDKPTGFRGYIKENGGLEIKDGYFIIESGNFEGVADSNGQFILDPVYDFVIFPKSESAKEIVVGAEGKYGLYNYEGGEILPIEYDGIFTSSLGTKYLVEKDGKQSIVNAKGKVEKDLKGTYKGMVSDVLLYGSEDNTNNSICMEINGTLMVDNASVSDGKSLYNLDEQCVYKGIIEEIGKNLICIYEETDDMRFIDNTGKELFAFEKYLEEFVPKELGNSLLDFFTANENYMEIRCLSGSYLYDIVSKKRIECRYNKVSISDDKAYGEVDGRIDIYENGSKKSSLEIGENEGIEFTGDFIVVKYGTTYRVYNEDGEEIIPERFASYDLFKQDVISVETLYGSSVWLDKNGEIEIPAGLECPDYYYSEEIRDVFECNGYLYVITWEDYEEDYKLLKVNIL